MKSITRHGFLVAAFALISFVAVALSIGHFLQPSRYSRPTFHFGAVSDGACGADNDFGSTTGGGQPNQPLQPIPNLVHYVWLLKEPTELRLSFMFFISVYSSHVLWRPQAIYIHTDAAPEVISTARTSGTVWTKRILAIPTVTFNHVETPETTTKGVKIDRLQHKADFVRVAALREFGGVYLDSDAVPLRDVAELRNSGFRNVLGGQIGLSMRFSGYLNNGVMMSVPKSSLMTIFYHAAHEFFDGEWETASIHLLTDLANRMVSIPSEVLILQPQAFDPTSWEYEDQKRLFKPAMDPIPIDFTLGEQLQGQQQTAAGGPGTCRDALSWLKQRESVNDSSDTGSEHAWELDFSSSYVLHAFDHWVSQILGDGRQIDLQYVLERRSNYARAVFPAVWHAVREGVIPRDEIVF